MAARNGVSRSDGVFHHGAFISSSSRSASAAVLCKHAIAVVEPDKSGHKLQPYAEVHQEVLIMDDSAGEFLIPVKANHSLLASVINRQVPEVVAVLVTAAISGGHHPGVGRRAADSGTTIRIE
ncbi:hypothetical protein EVAR_18665_1 [Eumeta japonica]|uniref:Uncharacterized protein n=1 Tax=Eumeta variegata TaxID=151549 RepID=A0A4C1U7X2_EUMVA|nr:hypothetical protein EVAR_18665_1 [Eumeta japonica]